MSYSINELEHAIKRIGKEKDTSEYMFHGDLIWINDNVLDLSLTYRLGINQFESSDDHARAVFEEMLENS